MPSGAFSIERDVYPHVAEDGLLSGFPFDGWFVDAGTPQSYIEAVQTSIVNGKFISGKIDGTNWTLSDIDSNVEKSSISEGVSIDSSSIVSNTTILGGCSVDARSILQGCMIGANTMIGSDVELIDVVVDFDAKIPTGHVQKGGTFPQ
jgi:mannose-1-phosphate guanylyltransferase